MAIATEQIVFGPFRCDPLNACVWREEQAVSLPPKAFDVLLHLLRHPGQLVSKEELLKTVWSDTYVGDAVLKVCVSEIRKVLADDPKMPQFIETIHRRGYRFIAPLRSSAPVLSNQFSASSSDKPDKHPPTLTTDNWQLTTRLVGRETEIAQLYTALENALAGQRQIVFVTGEPGIGKTALIETFVQSLASRVQSRDLVVSRETDEKQRIPGPSPHFSSRSAIPEVWVAWGQCIEHYGAGEAYLPVLEALGALSRGSRQEQLAKWLEQYAPTWLVQMPALTSPAGRQRLRQEMIGATPERMLREGAEALEAVTSEVPLILILEDLHWSDYATLDLVAALARRREPARLLVIGTYRPVDVIISDHPVKNLKQELQSHGQCEEIPLDLLAPSEVATYLQQRFPASLLPAEVTDIIHQRTDGNPLFLINVVEYLIAQGVFRQVDGRWDLRGRAAQIEEGIPESIRQMIERQLERLTLDEQQVLEVASIVGTEFSAATVDAALEEAEGTSEEHCERLARQQGFLQVREPKTWPDGTVTASYAFTHALYQSVLAQRVTAVRGFRFHQRIGERLEAAYGAQADAIAAELAIHFEQARLYPRAIHYLRQAAEHAARRYANREARQYLTHAFGLLGQIPEPEQAEFRLALLEQRGAVSRAMGDMPRAAEDFSALAVYAQELGLVETEVRALSQLAIVLSWINRDKCLEAEQRAALLSHNVADETLRLYVRSHTAYWHLLWRGWRQEDAQTCIEAVATARRTGDPAQLGMQLARLSFFLCLQSDYRAACEAGEEGLRLTREVDDVHSYLLCRIFLTRALLLRGHWGETLRVIQTGSDMAERNGHQRWALLLRLNKARLYEEAGDFVQTHDLCTHGLQQAWQMPLPYGQLVGAVTLGFAQLGLNQPRQAFETFADLQRRLAHERLLMDWVWQIPLHLGLAQYWLTHQDYTRACQEAEQLCTLAAQPGERTYVALGHRMLAEIALTQRKRDEAEQEVTLALAALDGGEAPLAEWRVHATAAQLAEQRRRKAQAQTHWQRSKAVVLRLADSLEPNDPLRQTFLSQPLITEILRRAG